MLLTTGNAWGELTPVSQDYSSGIADWTSGNVGRYTVDMNAGGYLTVNAVGTGDNGATITGSTVSNKAAAGIDFASSDDFTMIFDLQLNGGNNQCSFFHINDAANGGGNESEDGHMLTLYQTAVNGTTWRINHLESQTVTLTKSTWYTFKLTKSASYLYLTVTPKAGGNPVFERQRITVKSAKGGLGNMIFQTKRWYSFMAIDNVVLRAVEDGDLPDVTNANYTVHFKDGNGATIKDDEVRNDEVDSEVGASDADKVAFIAGGYKYVYKTDGGGTTVTNDGAAEFTVTYDKYESTAYTVKAQVGGTDLTTLASGTAYFDGSTTVYWNKYINVDDQWYVADGTTYGKAITTATNNVAFTAVDDIDYFFEAENMTYSRTYNTYSGTAASNGSAKTLYGDANAVTTTKVSPGEYSISINGIKWNDSYSDTYQIAYSLDKINWTALGTVTYENGTEGIRTLEGAVIPVESYIRIWATMGSQTPRRYLDYMVLDKTNDLTDVEIAILDCKKYDTSTAFATAIDEKSFSTAKEVYTFNTSYHVTNGVLTDGVRDVTGVIRNAKVEDATDWIGTSTHTMGTKYTGAPDFVVLDAYNYNMDAYQILYALPAGTYTVTVNSRGAADGNSWVYVNTDPWKSGDLATANTDALGDGESAGTLGYGFSTQTATFTITETTDIRLGFYAGLNKTNKWASCDDWHLYRIESVSKSISAAGWATYCSPYILDLEHATGLTDAYIVTGGNAGVLTKISVKGGTVPANTGLLLKGDAGTASIPVVATSNTDVNDNILEGVTEATVIPAETGWVLMGSPSLGFYQNANAFTVGANTAYIPVSDLPVPPSSGARAAFWLDDDATGINAIEAAEAENSVKDGKFLENGKIVIVKNGVKYSANGQKLN